MDMKIKRGRILRDLRLKRQLTQNEAAENFGISQQTYQKYESGKTEPPYDLLCNFAMFYGVSTDYLLGREETMPMPTPLKQLAKMTDMDVTEETIVDEYLKLPAELRQIIINFMKTAIKEAEKREASEKPPIQVQVRQGQGQEQAIARTSDPTKKYRPAPTKEQMKSFKILTPEDFEEK